jgi:hypothetical protein
MGGIRTPREEHANEVGAAAVRGHDQGALCYI